MSRTFTGSSGSYLESSANLTFEATTSYTFSAWIYPTAWGSTGSIISVGALQYVGLFINQDGGGGDGKGYVTFEFEVGKLTFSNAISVNDVLVLNEWQYLTAVFNASTGASHIYINGVELSYHSTQTHTGTQTNTDPLFIGNDATTGSLTAFTGYIDTVAIWNVALTPTQIQAAMAYQGTPGVLPSNLVAYWPLLGSSSPEPDSPTNTYPLTVSNAVQGPNSPGQQFPNPPPPPYTPTLPLPFSKRTTAAAAVFACLSIASPMQGAPTLTSNVAILTALQLEYAQLVNLYPVLIHQDTANNQADLYAAIATAIIVVGQLNSTIDMLMASGDQGFVLSRMQSIVASALINLKAAQFDESGGGE